MNDIKSFSTDVIANHISQQYVATILMTDTYNRRITLTFSDHDIAKLVTDVHDNIERHYGKEIADKIGVFIADQYYLHDDIVRMYCNSKGIPYDPFVELDEHHRFIRRMRMLSR